MWDELYHYGVPGMKWGVRKDDRLSYKIRYSNSPIEKPKVVSQNIRTGNLFPVKDTNPSSNATSLKIKTAQKMGSNTQTPIKKPQIGLTNTRNGTGSNAISLKTKKMSGIKKTKSLYKLSIKKIDESYSLKKIVNRGQQFVKYLLRSSRRTQKGFNKSKSSVAWKRSKTYRIRHVPAK